MLVNEFVLYADIKYNDSGEARAREKLARNATWWYGDVTDISSFFCFLNDC
jgi:hypothetical protein